MYICVKNKITYCTCILYITVHVQYTYLHLQTPSGRQTPYCLVALSVLLGVGSKSNTCTCLYTCTPVHVCMTLFIMWCMQLQTVLFGPGWASSVQYSSVLPRPFWRIGPISLTCGKDIGQYALRMYSASAVRS